MTKSSGAAKGTTFHMPCDVHCVHCGEFRHYFAKREPLDVCPNCGSGQVITLRVDDSIDARFRAERARAQKGE